MAIISLTGNKGGAGKTTLAVNLAAGLARQYPTAMVDADPQGSAWQWSVFFEDAIHFPVYKAEDDVHKQVRELRRHHDFVVIDCPPSVHAEQTAAVLAVSDTTLIPVQPSPVDLWATVHIEEAVNLARETNPALRSLIVINQMESRTILSKLVREALAEIGLPVARTALRRRMIYRASALEGKNIFDIGSRGKEAVDEFEQLINEVLTNGR